MIQYSNWTTDEFVRALSSNKPEASPQWGLFLQDLNDRKFTFWRLEWKQKKTNIGFVHSAGQESSSTYYLRNDFASNRKTVTALTTVV